VENKFVFIGIFGVTSDVEGVEYLLVLFLKAMNHR